MKESKEKINVLFIASNPDIELFDSSGNSYQQQKLKLDKSTNLQIQKAQRTS